MRLIFLFLISLTCSISCNIQNGNKLEGNSLKMSWKNEYDIASGIGVPPKVLNDSLILRTGDLYLACIRINDGSIKWQTQVSNTIALQTRVLINYNGNIFGTHVEDVRAWDIDSGEETWRLDLLDDRGYLSGTFGSIENDILFIAGYNTIKAINIFGNINFITTVKGGEISAIANNGKLYCGSGWGEADSTINGPRSKGRITCLDATNGDSIWAFDSEMGRFNHMAPIIENGVVYCGTVSGYSAFYALDAQTGELIWNVDSIYAWHAILEDDIVYVNAGDIIALNKYDGTVLWRTNLRAGTGTGPVAYLNGYIYHAHGGVLFILDAETGAIVHEMYSQDDTSFWFATTGVGKVFLQSGQHLYCYDPWDAED